jgi:hypothetical protein
VPSYKTIEEGRRKAMEALIDEIMEELRVPANIPVLHECRTLFRKKVPLTMRAYVAAALAYRFSPPGIPVQTARPGKASMRQAEGRPDSRSAPRRTPGVVHRKSPGRNPAGKPTERIQRNLNVNLRGNPRQPKGNHPGRTATREKGSYYSWEPAAGSASMPG